MRKCRLVFLFFILFFMVWSNFICAADVNIKLRKTDINDLKQQLMPAFEYNIRFLQDLLRCLEQGEKLAVCLEKNALPLDDNNQVVNKERNELIKQAIKKKVKADNIQQEEIIVALKRLLAGAEKAKQCLYLGQTANQLKNCVIQYGNSSQ
ncbi:MAG: hypothetical protein QNL62_09220 [Gammaproteobacteria bacterium]|nr:hypothetical protein [Gammaproteobacteria bacterium]